MVHPEYKIGFTWNAIYGKRTITRVGWHKKTLKQVFEVCTEGFPFPDVYDGPNDLYKAMQDDLKNLHKGVESEQG